MFSMCKSINIINTIFIKLKEKSPGSVSSSAGLLNISIFNKIAVSDHLVEHCDITYFISSVDLLARPSEVKERPAFLKFAPK